MGDTEDAIRNLAAYIESMSSDARQLCRLLRRLIAANKIKVANFDDYPDPVRLGLAWGFIDAASQLASVDFAEIRPTLPILFGRLRVPTEPDTIDYDAWELAEKLARTKQPNFAKARDKAGSVAWKYIPAAFDGDVPGLAFQVFLGALELLSDDDVSIRQPVAADPFDILETTTRLMRESVRDQPPPTGFFSRSRHPLPKFSPWNLGAHWGGNSKCQRRQRLRARKPARRMVAEAARVA